MQASRVWHRTARIATFCYLAVGVIFPTHAQQSAPFDLKHCFSGSVSMVERASAYNMLLLDIRGTTRSP